MNINMYRAVVQQRLSAVSRMYHLSYCNFCTSVIPDGSAELSPPLKKSITLPAVSQEPIILEADVNLLRRTMEDSRQAWIESLASTHEPPLGLITLHPDIFGFIPRPDIIHENLVWQWKYKNINFKHARLPVEMRGPGKGYGPKPWPQKGMGKARHGSTRGPQWVQGGTVHGPRRFTTQFFMLPFNIRLLGLISTLSCKFAQEDLKIVSSLELPSEDGSYLEDVVDERLWGDSVLFVDRDDLMPTNITRAADQVPQFNLLPLYGLNVHSMLKHRTLVMTVAAVERVQERLLAHMHNPMFRLQK